MTTNQISYAKNVEEARHNRVLEQISQDANAEIARSNRAREFETNRSNLANERIKRNSNDITDRHYLRTDQESQRHNAANEQLQAQSNAIAARNSNIQAALANAQSEQYYANADYLGGKADREQSQIGVAQFNALVGSQGVGNNTAQLGANLSEADSRNQLRDSEIDRNQSSALRNYVESIDAVYDDLIDLMKPIGGRR